jgi:Uma2 family endonuclease
MQHMALSDLVTSAQAEIELPPGTWPEQGCWTVADWERLPQGENRYEVIDGVLYVTKAPAPHHQWSSDTLIVLLRTYLAAQQPPIGMIFSATGVVLPTGPVIPDLVYFRLEKLNILTVKRITGVPDLMIEVASPGTAAYDRREKQDAYARSGVAEYWWVDPGNRSVEVLVLDTPGRYRPLGLVQGQSTIPSRELPGLQFPVDSIFMPRDLLAALPEE